MPTKETPKIEIKLLFMYGLYPVKTLIKTNHYPITNIISYLV